MNLSESLNTALSLPPYGLPRDQKAALFEKLLAVCTFHHSTKCQPYARYLRAIGFVELQETDAGAEGTDLVDSPYRGQCIPEEDVPFLPVSVFKEMDLRSIPEEEIFKVITSSGTSGQRPSRICLDGQTSALQQKVLARIVAEEIGEERLPCLMLDTKAVLRDRAHFSARGAGILGFSMFASRTCYALDEEMQLDLAEVQAFIEKHRQKALEKGKAPKFLLYGFTYMIWQYFVRALEAAGVKLDLAGSVLIHGGGWKKLEAEAVSAEEFAARIRAVTGIETVRSYYGMAEQTGCICMECACGRLHVSTWSDIIVRRERDYGVCAVGEPGVLQVLTPIAMSYPGHSLLTEDRGVLLGEDDCPCGRKGKYFKVLGRLPRAEVRGCSDTFENAH